MKLLGHHGAVILEVRRNLINLVFEVQSYLTRKIVDVELHVVLMALLQGLLLLLNIIVNSQECGDLTRVDVDKVLVWQVLQKFLGTVSTMLGEVVEDVLVLLLLFGNLNTSVSSFVVRHIFGYLTNVIIKK